MAAAAAAALFLLAALGMGLLISELARSQFVAGQIAIIATFLPAFILSGFIFDIGSMPAAVQVITHFDRRPLFRGDPADAVSRRQRLVGDPAQLRGAGGHGGRVPRRRAADGAQAAGLTAMWRQVLALIVKELLAVLKDAKSRVVLIGPPLIQLLVFGYAATFDLNHVPFAVYQPGSQRRLARLGGAVCRLSRLPRDRGAEQRAQDPPG